MSRSNLIRGPRGLKLAAALLLGSLSAVGLTVLGCHESRTPERDLEIGQRIAEIEDASLRQLLEERWAGVREDRTVESWLALGYAFEANEGFSAAEEVYRLVMEIDPADPRPKYRLGAVLEHLGRFEAARDALLGALSTTHAKPASAQAVVLWRLGSVEARLGNVEAARAAFDQAITLVPNEPAYRLARARLDLRSGLAEEAEARLRPLVEGMNPDSAESARRLLGEALRLQGRFDEAEPLLQATGGELLPRDDPWAAALVDSAVGFGAVSRRGVELLEAERWHEARDVLENLNRSHPDDVSIRLNLATARLGAGDVEGAIRDLEALLASGFERSLVHRNLAAAYFSAGRLPDAWRHAGRAAELGGQGARPYEIRAAILQRRGEFGMSLVPLEKARALEPDNPAILRQIGRAQERLGRWNAALETYERLAAVEEGPRGILRQAKALIELGRFDEATTRLDQAEGGALPSAAADELQSLRTRIQSEKRP